VVGGARDAFGAGCVLQKGAIPGKVGPPARAKRGRIAKNLFTDGSRRTKTELRYPRSTVGVGI
jgi:hypothetical protein